MTVRLSFLGRWSAWFPWVEIPPITFSIIDPFRAGVGQTDLKTKLSPRGQTEWK